MRMLHKFEIEMVSGGLVDTPEEPEIIVYGTKTEFDFSIYLDSFGNFSGTDYSDIFLEQQDPNADIWPVLVNPWTVGIVTTILGLIGGYVFASDAERQNAERDIGAKLGNTTVVNVVDTDQGRIFVGADGWGYTDSDGNGTVDTRVRRDGNTIQIDNGSGVRVLNISG